MATKKDLVEAHAFSRRRLVTAFLSGAPGGREVEPSRPGRTIVGGIALSVLLIAGAAIASVLASRTPADWREPGLILSRENAALYVILEGEDPPVLHPVINATSAQLIFGANATATIVDRDTVDQQTPGGTLGIFGAPQTLPTTGDLIQSGWTACTGDGLGLKVNVDRSRLVTPVAVPPVQSTTTQPGTGFTVRTADDGRTYLIATGRLDQDGERARYYEVPQGLDNALSSIGVATTDDAVEVPGDWLRLFEPGGTLEWDSFGIDDPGGPLPDALADSFPGARIGDYVPGAEGGDRGAVVLTGEGPLALDPFAAALYPQVPLPGGGVPRALAAGTPLPPGVTFAPSDYQSSTGWPDRLLSQPPGQACAVLTPRSGERPSVRLATEPRGEASAADVTEPTNREVRVQPGGGAFVYSGTFADATSDTAFVVDPKGDIYPLVDDQTIERLRYSEVPPIVVPDTWVKLFDDGVALSTSAALCPPFSPDGDEPAPDQDCGPAAPTGEAGGDAADAGTTGTTGTSGTSGSP